MARAILLARRGRYAAHPNPMVGCVIVDDAGSVVGEGYHRRAGEAHAEVNALEVAAGRARGATAYVSLEPCAHHGKTPPCANALIKAGVGRVIAAMVDPNPAVSGKGLATLEAAGIRTASGLLSAEAETLNRGFIRRMTTGRPFVTVKLGASLDGATAMRSGESQWITGPAAREDVQRLRARSGAILTGAGTVVDDDPRLTVRGDVASRIAAQPICAILDSTLRTPSTATVLEPNRDSRIYHCGAPLSDDLVAAGATLVAVPAGEGGVDPMAVLDDLGALGVNDVLVEAGAMLAGSLAALGLVDEFVIYMAPMLLGSETRPLLATPGWTRLADGLPLDIVDIRSLDRDLRITARPADRHDTEQES